MKPMYKTISSKSHMLLAYADDIDIIGRNMRKVAAVFPIIKRESAKFGLAVNDDRGQDEGNAFNGKSLQSLKAKSDR